MSTKGRDDRKCIWIINQFAGTDVSGWGERHFYLSRGFLEQGYRVSIISSGNNHMFNNHPRMKGWFTGELVSGIQFLWVKIPSYNPQSPMRFVAMFFFAFSMLMLPFKTKLIGKPSHIVVSSMSIFPAPVGLFLRRLLGAKKFVFEVRDLWPLTPIYLMGYSRRHPLIKIIGWIEALAYRKADEIVSVLKASDTYINPISRNASKYHYIPNGIDDNLLSSAPNQGQQLALNVPSDRLIVCYAGTLGYANAMDPFFRYVREEGKDQEDLFFLVIGDGYLKQQYQEQVDRAQNILFVDKVRKENVQSYLQLADIFFIAWHDCDLYKLGVSANKYFDYMAAGKPILCAQHDIEDPVARSGCGIIVRNEEEDIAKGIARLKQMGESEREELGRRGRAYVEEHHRFSLLSGQYLKILERSA